MDVGKWVLGFLLSASFISFESDAQDYLNKEIYLKAGQFRLDSVLLTITRQTKVVFSYNSKKIDSRQKIMVKANTKTLGHFLDLLRKEKALAIKIIENYVVLSLPDNTLVSNSIPSSAAMLNNGNDFKKATAAKTKPALIPTAVLSPKSPLRVASKSVIMSALPQEIEILPVSKKWEVVVTEASRKQQQKIEAGIGNNFKLPVIPAFVQKPDDNIGKVALTQSPPIKNRFFLAQGLTVDESSFMGLTLQVGLFRSVYVTVSGNTNLLASHIRYGMGTSIKLTSGVRLHITANTGDLVRSGHFTDSLGNSFPITIKSNLLRFGVGAEWSMRNKFSLQIIPIFNFLSTHYFINQVPADLHLFNGEGDRLFYDITAPYFLTNTFSPTSTENVKTWIGLQVNLLYKINF